MWFIAGVLDCRSTFTCALSVWYDTDGMDKGLDGRDMQPREVRSPLFDVRSPLFDNELWSDEFLFGTTTLCDLHIMLD